MPLPAQAGCRVAAEPLVQAHLARGHHLFPEPQALSCLEVLFQAHQVEDRQAEALQAGFRVLQRARPQEAEELRPPLDRRRTFGRVVP